MPKPEETMIQITKNLATEKATIFSYYRNRAAESLQEVRRTHAETEYKSRAAAINQALAETKDTLVRATLQRAQAQKWSNEEILRTVLMLTYTNYVVMLESRNDVWPYEYMAFSRRIGELWEPFCKLCFDHPLRDLEYFVPPLFFEVKDRLRTEIVDYIKKLTLTDKQTADLLRYYDKVWSLVTSGEIKLELDLHFKLNGVPVNVDFKSGFGSNEKGNTNRLLLVATIYHNLEENHRCILLVRSEEDQNNNYFQTLKNSSVWDAYCGKDAYKQIREFSGFDIKGWIDTFVKWSSDLKAETMKHFATANLDQYLKW